MRTDRRATLGLLLTVLLALPTTVLAAPSPARLQLTTERVIVFKNGYCLVIKRGVVTTAEDGTAFTDEVPDSAVLGSFWATPEKGSLVSMTADWVTAREAVRKQVDCTEPLEVLLANTGKACTIRLSDGAVVRGTITKVLVKPAPEPLAPALRQVLRLRAAPPGAKTQITRSTGSQFVLSTEDGDLLLPISMVRTLQIKAMKTTLERTVETTRKAKRLTLRFAKGKTHRTVRMMYFRPGIRWIPTYRVDLSGGTDAKGQRLATVALQAELLNEAEDLKGTKLDLVVGVPNFRFQAIPSPLVLEATLRNALASAAPAIMGNNRSQLSNALYSQRSGERRRAAARAPVAPAAGSLPAELSTTASQDLFVYHLPALSLARGARMAVPIFTSKVPFRDVYTWTLHTRRSGSEGTPSAGVSSPLRLSTNRVWHQVALTNTTGMPWTTGAAMLLDGQQPLSQELLTYTSARDEVRVPVTVAVDLRGTYTERETGRQHSAIKWSGYRYAKITKQGKLALCNHKAKAITIEITCELGGRATAASGDGVITLGEFARGDWTSYHGHPAVNNHSTIRWTKTLEPGQVIELTVDQHYFVRE